jgi:hypothetical protein
VVLIDPHAGYAAAVRAALPDAAIDLLQTLTGHAFA